MRGFFVLRIKRVEDEKIFVLRNRKIEKSHHIFEPVESKTRTHHGLIGSGCTASGGSRPLERATLSREPPRGGSQQPTNQLLPPPLPNKHFRNHSSQPPTPSPPAPKPPHPPLPFSQPKILFPGHALHEKRLQRHLGVGTLVSSQDEERPSSR